MFASIKEFRVTYLNLYDYLTQLIFTVPQSLGFKELPKASSRLNLYTGPQIPTQ